MMLNKYLNLKPAKYICLWMVLWLNLVSMAQVNTYNADNKCIASQGRVLPGACGSIEMISSASLVEFQFSGDLCTICLRNISAPGDYNYVSLEVDDTYTGRLRVTGKNTQQSLIKPSAKKAWHTLRVYKATEASNGLVVFEGVQAAQIKPVANSDNRKIEFIGNSITCGMGNDNVAIPCGEGSKWYDQHNAYWSYAAITARTLGVHFMLSSISGAGIYRNWNSNGPTVPQQYESAYLRSDSLARWDFSVFIPDIVCIALGTNDLSTGDGTTARPAFDSAVFINKYVNFIGVVYSHYPHTRIVLLSSPMVNDKRSELLVACLQSVQQKASARYKGGKKISIFNFGEVPSTGCSGHPTIAEHKLMATRLVPFINQLLND